MGRLGQSRGHVEVTPLWQRGERIAAEMGLVATGYEGEFGGLSRAVQFALAYLFHASSDVYTCPLAMTDGAARTLLDAGNQGLVDRAVGHLTSRDPAQFWTSGQWMTESTGGSDVGLSETVAARDADGRWRLSGRKWFTSAVTSQMALTLARPEGSGPGGRGLALFYVEMRDGEGRLNHIDVLRLKDKLGTRKVPTAELVLDGTVAELVTEEAANGTRHIAPMLAVTRTWNSVCAVATMRRGVALARDYARRRVAFGRPLVEQPLHVDTLAGLQAELEAAFHLTFFLIEQLGRLEVGDDGDAGLVRLLTPVVKLTTGRMGVAAASEVLEAFGGAGYVEDTGLPLLLRDSQVLPIWEGTTNVLSLDLLRAMGHGADLKAPTAVVERCAAACREPGLANAARTARAGLDGAARWLTTAMSQGEVAVEAGARRFALTVGRSLALALLAEHAQWALDTHGDARPRAAALRFAADGVDQGTAISVADADSRMLADDQVAAGRPDTAGETA